MATTDPVSSLAPFVETGEEVTRDRRKWRIGLFPPVEFGRVQRGRAPVIPGDGAAVTLPGPAAALFVQICCKGPDRAGAREENR